MGTSTRRKAGPEARSLLKQRTPSRRTPTQRAQAPNGAEAERAAYRTPKNRAPTTRGSGDDLRIRWRSLASARFPFSREREKVPKADEENSERAPRKRAPHPPRSARRPLPLAGEAKASARRSNVKTSRKAEPEAMQRELTAAVSRQDRRGADREANGFEPFAGKDECRNHNLAFSSPRGRRRDHAERLGDAWFSAFHAGLHSLRRFGRSCHTVALIDTYK